jgi:hypothetical protein
MVTVNGHKPVRQPSVTGKTHYQVRFPNTLYRTVKAMADSEHRSVNQQILYLLEIALGERVARS